MTACRLSEPVETNGVRVPGLASYAMQQNQEQENSPQNYHMFWLLQGSNEEGVRRAYSKTGDWCLGIAEVKCGFMGIGI
jgi:hypothetical protein